MCADEALNEIKEHFRLEKFENQKPTCGKLIDKNITPD